MKRCTSYTAECPQYSASYKFRKSISPKASKQLSLELAIWVLLTLWSLQSFVGWRNIRLYRLRMPQQDERLGAPLKGAPQPAALVLPMKGIGDSFDEFIQSVLNQDYFNYQVLLSVESKTDPLYGKLRDHLGLTDENPTWQPASETSPSALPLAVAPGLKRIQLIVAGVCEKSAQKVHNQLQALENLRANDGIIAGCDSDFIPPPDMLTRLTAPLNQGTHDASTGYRWLVPLERRFSMWTASVINASVATLGGPEWSNLIWGGAFALDRNAGRKIDLKAILSRSFNDDLQITHFLRKAGMKIAFVRSLLLPSPGNFSWSELLEFGRVQYFHVRFYAPWAWWCALFITALYVAASLAAWALLLSGDLRAVVPIGIVGLFNQLRASHRIRLVSSLFSTEQVSRLRPVFVLERLGTLFWMTLHFAIVCASGLGNSVTWSGVTYWVKGRKEVEIASRFDAD